MSLQFLTIHILENLQNKRFTPSQKNKAMFITMPINKHISVNDRHPFSKN